VTPIRHPLAPAALGLLLCGCVSLLPDPKPVSLYRFEAPALQADDPPEPRLTRAKAVLLTNPGFDRTSAGDRIVAVKGDEVFYIAGARWAVPADVMFQAALGQAFDATPGPARLVRRGDPGGADYILRLNVDRFEAQYRDGADRPPTVVVSMHALLVRKGDRAVIGEQVFEAQAPAAANRVSAFVPAYEQALGQSLHGLSAWVQQSVASAS